MQWIKFYGNGIEFSCWYIVLITMKSRGKKDDKNIICGAFKNKSHNSILVWETADLKI